MNRIKELRKSKNLKQKELAEILNTNASSICSWEKGDYNPNSEQLIKLSKYFNCSVDYLMGYSDTILITDTSSNSNKITLRGRNGRISEYILTDEEMEAYEKIFQNREKYRSKNDGNF